MTAKDGAYAALCGVVGLITFMITAILMDLILWLVKVLA